MSRPVERVGFVILCAGLAIAMVIFIWYGFTESWPWEYRFGRWAGNFWDRIHRRGRVAGPIFTTCLFLIAGGYLVAYHFDATAGRIIHWISRLLNWIRTGR